MAKNEKASAGTVSTAEAKPRLARRTPAGNDDAAALQLRLLEAQATIERDYKRLRELEARYRHLFDTAEGLLVVDGASLRIMDANAAASLALGLAPQKAAGALLTDLLEPRSAAPLEAMAAEMLSGGQPGSLRVEPRSGTGRLSITASLFRQDGAVVLLLRMASADTRSARADRDARDSHDDTREDWASYTAGGPDGVVLTDLAGRVLQANASFVELVQVATERQVRGESLGRWLGRTSVDLGVLITNLRQRGNLKLFATSLRAEYGSVTEVEISAALVSVGEHSFLGFTIRDVGRRLSGDTRAGDDLSKSVGQLAELVGRVPMKDIVGNTASLIEKMCIEAALQLTRDNRAAAAELLGLSRQSLYVKLRRYGLGDLGSEEEEAAV